MTVVAMPPLHPILTRAHPNARGQPLLKTFVGGPHAKVGLKQQLSPRVHASKRSGISVARCMGKSVATVTRDSALERGLFSTKWQAQKGQSQWGSFLAPAGQQGSAHGEKACDGIPLHKHHSILAPCFWQSQFPPQVFLVVNILILAPICCLLLPRSSPLCFTLQSACFSTQPLCTLMDTRPRLGHSGLYQGSSG